MDFTPITKSLEFIIYFFLAGVALWGAYCCIVIWRRVAQLRFGGEEEQDRFLDEVARHVDNFKENEMIEYCEDDPRAVSMLSVLAVKNKDLTLPKLKTLLIERFQRDILADLDYRVTWVQTIIKAAPMLGLFGTVVGMMSAFGKLSTASEVSPDKLAADIMFALVTTAIGLSIAIPLVLAMASITNKIGQLEDLVGAGLTRIIDIFGKK